MPHHNTHHARMSAQHAHTTSQHGQHDPHTHHAHMVEDFQRRFWISLGLTLPILALSPMIQDFLGLGEALRFPGDLWVLWALSSVVFFYGGWPFLKGVAKELRQRNPGMMTLIAIAISVAYLYSSAVVFGLAGTIFFWELATLIDVMLLGHWIEMRSVLGASRALEELARLMPTEAHRVMPDGSIQDVPLDQLQVGDRVLVRPGEKIPADSVIVEGHTTVNEALLTGESAPVEKKAGDTVIGGSINGEGSLTLEVQKTGAESYLSQVIELVRQAQESKSRTQDLAKRAARWLTAVALGGGALTLAVWMLLMGQPFDFALERMVTVMVIACPHALGLAVPLVVTVSTALAAKSGLLIRDRAAFENARTLQAVIFDKTGTLTEGRFGVTDTLVFQDGHSKAELLMLAAAVEQHSEHPIARGIVEAAPQPPAAKDFEAIPGKGARARVNGQEVQVVSPVYLREHGLEVHDERIDQLAEQGKTVVFVVCDGHVIGAIALADVIRPASKEAVQQLKAMGLQVMMLTGDNRRVAAWVAREIGLDDYFAEVLPDQKAAKVKAVQQRGLRVAMVGDGINDAPALAQADLGIAIGAGTEVAIETADIVLVRNDPRDVVSILRLSRATYRKMVQNLWWAAGYNIIAIPLAAGVLYKLGLLLEPAIGAILMSASTVIVAINARFLSF